MHHDPLLVRMQIEQLIREYPELAEDETLRADMLEGCTSMHDELNLLLDAYFEKEAFVEGAKVQAANLRKRIDRFEQASEATKRIMFSILQAAGLKKVVLPDATLSIRTGTPKVIVTDEAALPDILCRIKREPNKTAIKAALELGEVPGALLSNAEDNLTIRTK